MTARRRPERCRERPYPRGMRYGIAQLVASDEENGRVLNLLPRLMVADGIFEAYRDAHRAVVRFLHTNPQAIVRNDLNFHRVVLADLAEGYEKDDEYPQRKALGLSQMALASVLNFSVGVGLYQEHSQIRAGRNGGDKFRMHVEKTFRDEYDRCPDLFLMKRIRDVAVHSSLDLVSVVSGTRVTDVDVTDVHKFSGIHLNVKTLMTQDKINQRLKDHLRSLGPDISAVEVMERAITDLTRIDNAILPYCYPNLLDQCRMVLAFRDHIMEELGDLTGVVVSAYDEETGESVLNEDGSLGWHQMEGDSHVERFATELVASASPTTPSGSHLDS
jgi:hypothetical protein